MPSTLLFYANHINQKINNIQLPIFPVEWSLIKRQWILCNYKKVVNYLIFSCAWKLSATVAIILSLILAMKNSTLVQIEQIFVCVVVLQALLATIITDLILVMFGEEIVGCCNWCYKAENEWQRYSIDSWFSLKHISSISKCSWYFRKGKQ